MGWRDPAWVRRAGSEGYTRSHLRVGRKEVQGCDAETELLRLGELPEAGAQGHQALPRDARSHLQQLLTERGRSLSSSSGRAPKQAGSRARGVPVPGPHSRSPQVVDAVPVQAEAVSAVGPVHQQLDVLIDAVGTGP